MNASSEKRLTQLHPALATVVRDLVTTLATQGIVVEVVQGMRTFAEQDALYAQGRTKPGAIVTQARGGESNHNYGLAADLCPFKDGKPDWNAPISVWATIGMAATARGLEWGGNWKKFLDKPHVQAPVTLKECQRCYEHGGIEAVWSAASQKLTWGGRRLEVPPRASVRKPTLKRTTQPRKAKLARKTKPARRARTPKATPTRKPQRTTRRAGGRRRS